MTSPCDLASADAVILAPRCGGAGFFAQSEPGLACMGTRPLVPHLLDQLGDAGCQRVIVSTGDASDEIRTHLGTSYQGIELAYPEVGSTDSDPTGGSVEALRQARPLLSSGPALVLDADSYCPADLLDLWEWHHVRPAHLTLATPMVSNAQNLQPVWVDENQRILRVMEGAAIEGPGLVNSGVYLMHTPLIDRIPDRAGGSLHRDLLPRWIEAGGVFGYPTSAPFIDARTPQRLEQAQNFFRIREAVRRRDTTPAEELSEPGIVESF